MTNTAISTTAGACTEACTDSILKKVISKERRQKYNQTYYDKHRFKLLKIANDKKAALKKKKKLVQTLYF